MESAPVASSTSAVTQTTEQGIRDCLRPTGGTEPIDSGTTSQDALFLSGELFVCAPDVVVVAEDDINEVAVAAQLAAALGGPLLFPDDRLAVEIGRLHPNRVHVIGRVDLNAPTETEVQILDITGAVQMASEALGVTEVVRLSAIPDASAHRRNGRSHHRRKPSRAPPDITKRYHAD